MARAFRFALDLKKFGELTEERATKAFRKIVLDLDRRIVMDTPVDTGRAINNWFPTKGGPSKRFVKSRDKTGARSLARIDKFIPRLVLGNTAWFTNNVSYILLLEDGYSKKSPEGMVERNLRIAASTFGGSFA